MKRIPLIAANWKMHKTSVEAKAFMKELLPAIAEVKERDVLICPSHTLINAVNESRDGSNVLLGAQNMYFEASGAFTGEVSASMLKDLNCEFVILGHSERRWVFNESDQVINKKVIAAFNAELLPVLCVGEKLEEREKGLTEQVILDQLEKNLKDVTESWMQTIVIAYEPVWAIGTGKNATSKDALEAINLIREYIHSRYGSETSNKVRILYGGSVKPDNISNYMQHDSIDGALVGGASLEPESFASLVKFE